jgi:hypothetical protein
MILQLQIIIFIAFLLSFRLNEILWRLIDYYHKSIKNILFIF